jgi:putative PIN family toxin of toxin-antitoxin system
MTAGVPRVVFDCNVFIQAVLSAGPAFRCLALIEERRIELLLSPDVLAEARDVLYRPKLRRKNPQMTSERVERLLAFIAHHGVVIEHIAKITSFPRDPKDEPYLNLSIAGKAHYLVSRDRDLLDLMTNSPEAQDFQRMHPGLKILSPEALLGVFAPPAESDA